MLKTYVKKDDMYRSAITLRNKLTEQNFLLLDMNKFFLIDETKEFCSRDFCYISQKSVQSTKKFVCLYPKNFVEST